MENDDSVDCLQQELLTLRSKVIELEKSEAELKQTKRTLEKNPGQFAWHCSKIPLITFCSAIIKAIRFFQQGLLCCH